MADKVYGRKFINGSREIVLIMTVTNARINKGRATIIYNGEKLSARIKIRPTRRVAEKSHKRKEIYIDPLLACNKNYFKAAAIHELVEGKNQRRGLPQQRAHLIASREEGKFWHKNRMGNIKQYCKKVDQIWRKRNNK
jgi:hypothetical protein